MKKLLITGALLSALSTSALAEVGNVYFRLDGGMSLLSNPADSNYFSQKFENRNTPFINLGIGWSLMENLRADLNFSYQLNDDFTANKLIAAQLSAAPFTTLLADSTNYAVLAVPTATLASVAAAGTQLVGTKASAATDLIVELASVSAVTVQDTLKMFSIIPRIYYDLFDYGNGKFFVGAGLGYANLQYQTNITTSYTAFPEAEVKAQYSNTQNIGDTKVLTANPADASVTLSSPTKANFAWSLHAGMDYKIPSWEGVSLNLEYSYTSYGQVKQLTVSKVNVDLANPIKVNMSNLSLGLRIEM